LKQTGDAQGDFARTSGGLANQQRILSAQVDNWQAGLGQMLLPAMLALTKAVNAAIPVLSSFGTWIKNNAIWLGPLAAALALVVTVGYTHAAVLKLQTMLTKEAIAQNVIYKGAMLIWTGVQKAATAAQWLWNAALTANPIGLVVVAIAALVAGIIIAYKKVGWFRAGIQAMGKAAVAAFNWIKQAAGVLWGVMKTVFSWTPLGIVTKHFGAIVGFFKGLPARIKSGLSTVATTLTTPFKTAFNAIAALWNNTVGRISFTVPSWVPKLGGNGFSMPQIPMMADGGIVTSPTLALLGEAGPEAVVPLSKGRGMGRGGDIHYHIKVTPRGSVLASKKEIADTVLDALKAQKNNGRQLGLA
jgi:hypothetical protein